MRLLSATLLCVIIAVAACQPQVAPTLTPSIPPPTLTPSIPPPTNTPAPTSTPLIRATLPPTWTPVIIPTETPTPLYTPFGVLEGEASPVCAEFGEDFTRNSTTFALGRSPQVFWRPLTDAQAYRVVLYGPDGSVLFDGLTPNTSFTFDGALFTEFAVYSWEVIPIDANRVQTCPASGSVLIAAVE